MNTQSIAKVIARLGLMLSLALGVALPGRTLAADAAMYADALAAEWENWSWGSALKLDDISLLAGTAAPPGAVSLSIDAGAGRHAISEDIYGMNFADEALAAELRLPVSRWGGNATTRYNLAHQYDQYRR